MSNGNHIVDIKTAAMAGSTAVAAGGGGTYALKTGQWVDVYGQLITFGLTCAGALIPLLFVAWQWRRAIVKARREDEEWKRRQHERDS